MALLVAECIIQTTKATVKANQLKPVVNEMCYLHLCTCYLINTNY